ncbi:hypothetical protein OSTOST_24020, partial [Ostertagia ostertagi]
MESFYKELSEEERARAELGLYDFDHPCSDGMLCLEPADVIIVEGILTFYDERIREKFTMKLFVDADADVRLARRVKRDTVYRKRPLAVVLSQYTNL